MPPIRPLPAVVIHIHTQMAGLGCDETLWLASLSVLMSSLDRQAVNTDPGMFSRLRRRGAAKSKILINLSKPTPCG